jgi:hypothetical protein
MQSVNAVSQCSQSMQSVNAVSQCSHEGLPKFVNHVLISQPGSFGHVDSGVVFPSRDEMVLWLSLIITCIFACILPCS